MKDIKVTFLGTGTSHGVPMITCECPVCRSKDPRNKRLRSSLMIKDGQGNTLLIDCSKDFREQALRHRIAMVEHILITHLHADHVFGIDELRIYNSKSGRPVKLYLKENFAEEIKTIFPYIYSAPLQKGGGITAVENIIVKPGEPFTLRDLKITPLRVHHGKLEILGYRINDTAYLTDTSAIPEETYGHLKNLDLLIIGALRLEPHATHFSLDQAIEEARKIGARRTYFTHISHKLDHKKTNAALPPDMKLAHDGLIL